MIPKIIHYCWFGNNKLTSQAKKCLKSWKKFCPDYTIIEWNESNFDINCNAYVKKAYEEKKYAFVSDVARLHAITTIGGIYFDTDYELKKPLSSFLDKSAFLGWESKTILGTAILACEKGHPFFTKFLSEYDTAIFEKVGNIYLTNTVRLTMFALPLGLKQDNSPQLISSVEIFPTEYFYPKDAESGIIKKSPNTYGIHHFSVSYISFGSRLRIKIYRLLHKLFGKNFAKKLYSLFGRNNT